MVEEEEEVETEAEEEIEGEEETELEIELWLVYVTEWGATWGVERGREGEREGGGGEDEKGVETNRLESLIGSELEELSRGGENGWLRGEDVREVEWEGGRDWALKEGEGGEEKVFIRVEREKIGEIKDEVDVEVDAEVEIFEVVWEALEEVIEEEEREGGGEREEEEAWEEAWERGEEPEQIIPEGDWIDIDKEFLFSLNFSSILGHLSNLGGKRLFREEVEEEEGMEWEEDEVGKGIWELLLELLPDWAGEGSGRFKVFRAVSILSNNQGESSFESFSFSSLSFSFFGW